MKFFVVFCLTLFAFSVYSQKNNEQVLTNTAGELTFTVRTVTQNGTYAPRHVLAIWIEDANGFVKTRLLRAVQRKQYLYTWVASSGMNSVDAVTGPTLTSHTTHTSTWNCKDLQQNIVPDGQYKVCVEFTEKHAQGPYYEIPFEKGTTSVHLTPADQTYFKDMVLDYVPLVPDFNANITETCVNSPVVFTDNSLNATSWLWDFGAGASPATSNTQGPHTVSYNTAGPKTVSLTINSAATLTRTDYITAYASPVAGFTYTTGSHTVTFSNTSVNATNYNWDFGDGNTSSDENPAHTYANGGTYVVTLTSSNTFCSDAVHTETILVSGTGTIENKAGFSIYPNPGNGIFRINTPFIKDGQVKAEVFNAAGKVVYSGRLPVQSNVAVLLLDKQALGIYFIRLELAGKTWYNKLLIR